MSASMLPRGWRAAAAPLRRESVKAMASTSSTFVNAARAGATARLTSRATASASASAPVRAFAAAPPHSQPRPVDAELDAGMPQFNETPFVETVPDHLAPSGFVQLLKRHDIDFFTGVPDSLLKDFAGYVARHTPSTNHVITANEGNAVALAAGYHIATGRTPVVYMQNSGIGNAVNPLLSLTSKKVYSIPMLILVGWRGEPGRRDEPQHTVQGQVMPALLASLGIRYEVLPDYSEGVEEAVKIAVSTMRKTNTPYVFLVRKNTFTQYKPAKKANAYDHHPMNREEAIGHIIDTIGPYDATVATTGFTSRELYEAREKRGEGQGRDFLMVGSMGHATSFALGVALNKADRNVICIDGDGALLMHTGTMATIGQYAEDLSHFKHVLINNAAHDSVGAQDTAASNMNFKDLSSGFGYKGFRQATNATELADGLRWMLETPGPVMLEVKVRAGARKDLGRPKSSTLDNKQAFMEFLGTQLPDYPKLM